MLRFGDFDGDRRTDVFSLANSQWSVSYGGSTAWQRLNRRLSSNLGELVFADFDGDGKTDVARTSSGSWQLSSGGATPWRALASGRSEPLSIGMLFGDFDGDGRDDVVQHGVKSSGRPLSACKRPLFRSFEPFKLSPGGAGPLAAWSRVNLR